VNTIKQRFLMTASELAMGRMMRAPDHDASTTGAAAAPENGAADDDFAAFEKSVTAPKPAAVEAPAAAEGTETTDTGENGTGEGEPTEDGAKPAAKGKTVQERIDEITAARREAERKADEAARQAEYWRGKAEGAKPSEEAPKVEDAAVSDGEPDPSKYEYGEADPKFILDMARYGARKEFEELRQGEAMRAQAEEAKGKWHDKAASAVEKYPDFKEKVMDTADKVEWPCSPIVGEGIIQSEVGADIAYHLATNVEEAKAIYAMNPLEQARAFGRLEAKFMAETAKAEAPAPKIVTDAPIPPENRARGAGGKFSVADDTEDFAAFEAKHSRGRK